MAIGCQVRKSLSWLLVLGAIVLSILLSLGMVNIPPATAAIRQLEEAPGQMVYQSRQTLKDQQGHRWQTIAFKRVRPEGQTSFELRLVGFPGVVEVDRTQPLTLTDSLGNTLVATAASDSQFAEPDHLPNVGQYNLQPLLSQLRTEVPLQLTLPTRAGETVHLSISPALIQEWKSVAAQDGNQNDEMT